MMSLNGMFRSFAVFCRLAFFTSFANSLNLQKILGDNNLGKLTTALKLNGKLHEGQKPDVNAEGLISQLD